MSVSFSSVTCGCTVARLVTAAVPAVVAPISALGATLSLVDTVSAPVATGCSPAIATAPAPKNTLHPMATEAIPTLNFLIE